MIKKLIYNIIHVCIVFQESKRSRYSGYNGEDTPPQSPMSQIANKEISAVSISVTFIDGETSVLKFQPTSPGGKNFTLLLH